jgi:hypothetical protein
MFARSAFQPRKRERVKQPDPKRCPPYIKWLRRLPCFLSHHDKPHRCEGTVQACHFDPWGDKGMGTKVSDMAAMPMCAAGHIEQTDILGWPDFQRKYEFDGRDVVTAYWTEFLKTREGRLWLQKVANDG